MRAKCKVDTRLTRANGADGDAGGRSGRCGAKLRLDAIEGVCATQYVARRPTAGDCAVGCALQESEQVADLKSKLKRTLDAYRKQEQVRHARLASRGT